MKAKAKVEEPVEEEGEDEEGRRSGDTEDEDEDGEAEDREEAGAEPVDGGSSLPLQSPVYACVLTGTLHPDELAEIDGIKPKVYMKDGDETQVKSATSSSTYKVKRTWDHYYCACPVRSHFPSSSAIRGHVN